MTFERTNSVLSNRFRSFTTDQALTNFECHSIALNEQETRLLLVGNHELALINFETIVSQFDNAIRDNTNISLPSICDIKPVSLFDMYNVNRPIVEWNQSEANQCAVAIDRLVRFYTVDHAHISETNTVIDSQHQRPISSICFSPYDPCWLLTGSLDGQIQVWDTRHCSSKSPASLKFTVSTPFSIRRIQWSSKKSNNLNQLAVQCDRCVRIYDIRRTDSYLLSSTDLEHKQRIVGMDWTKQNLSIVTVSADNSIKVFSTNGQILAESISNEPSPYTLTKVRTTTHDSLFVSAARDSAQSTYGFVGWRWDGDQYLQPLTSRIISTTPSPIVDFCLVTHPRFSYLLSGVLSSSNMSDDFTNNFVLLAWCRNGTLCLLDMDTTFRQAWVNQQIRNKTLSPSDTINSLNISQGSSHLSMQPPTNRGSWSLMPMGVVKSETADYETINEEYDDDDNPFQEVPTSPPNTAESSEASDDNECAASPEQNVNVTSEVSIENELNSILGTYGPYIVVARKDVERRGCVLRCIYNPENNISFEILLTFSRDYPIVSQLAVRFRQLTAHNDERLKSFQIRIQNMLDETSYKCFYHGHLCLHKCLIKLKNLFEKNYKHEKQMSSMSSTLHNSLRKHNQSLANFDMDSVNGFTRINSNNITNSNDNISTRAFIPSTSSTRTNDTQMSGISFAQGVARTCGARFSGSYYLVCFGRIAKTQQIGSTSALTTLNDGTINRPQSLPLRSTSLTVTKTRENSSTDEQSSYRTTTTGTNTVQIQYVPNNQRLPIFSAPVRSSYVTNIFPDHQRISTPYRRSLGQLIQPHSTVSLYDVSILLPVSKKLADDYKIDLKNSIDMCETNQGLARDMGKNDLSHCWRLLGGLLSLQSNVQQDDSWFQTPLAHGLVKHLVSNYVLNGDIQSASMFLLTMSQTPYLKTKIQSRLVNEHEYDPILYAYACLLHRWRYFYKRTQILSEIDHNCQSPAPFNQSLLNATITIICSICLQPVVGQHFLCAICSHGGHLTHMHDWFSSEGFQHRYCPEKDCTCRCILKQQELLTVNTVQLQQYASTATPRSYLSRQPSTNMRPL